MLVRGARPVLIFSHSSGQCLLSLLPLLQISLLFERMASQYTERDVMHLLLPFVSCSVSGDSRGRVRGCWLAL